STLMGLTYDQQRPGQTKLRSDAFAIFYFAINIGAAISQFAMPPIRTSYGYRIAFLFPAVLMLVAFRYLRPGKNINPKRRLFERRRLRKNGPLNSAYLVRFLVFSYWSLSSGPFSISRRAPGYSSPIAAWTSICSV